MSLVRAQAQGEGEEVSDTKRDEFEDALGYVPCNDECALEEHRPSCKDSSVQRLRAAHRLALWEAHDYLHKNCDARERAAVRGAERGMRERAAQEVTVNGDDGSFRVLAMEAAASIRALPLTGEGEE